MAAFAKSRPAPALGVAAGALSERSWRVMLVGGALYLRSRILVYFLGITWKATTRTLISLSKIG
jgi:hypothetical protein